MARSSPKAAAARRKYQEAAADTEPGEGSRFAALKESIASEGGVRNPGAVAAAIGRKKYGSKRFAEMGRKGKK
jgi:hypothetical protein